MDISIVSVTRKEAFELIVNLVKLIFVRACVQLEVADDHLVFLCSPEQLDTLVDSLAAHNEALEES